VGVAAFGADVLAAPPPAPLVAAVVALADTSAEVRASILQMSNGAIHAMFWKKCRTLLVVMLIAGVCGVGIGAGRGDQPGPGGGDDNRPKPRGEVRPPSDEQRAQARDRLRDELAHADKVLEEADAKLAVERAGMRGQVIGIEEKLRELEFRQAWQRDQQRRTLQNLETTLRDKQAQEKTLEARLREREIELGTASRSVQRLKELQTKGGGGVVAAAEVDQANGRFEALRRTFENESATLKQTILEIDAAKAAIEKATKESLAGEGQRTADRVKLRQELAALEEQAQARERSALRQRDRLAADVDLLSAKMRHIEGVPAAPVGRDVGELERQVEALKRELNDLRRDLKRATKPE
jgi:hypothetical protein